MELGRNLQQALEAHRRMLNKHLKIWKKAQEQHAQDLLIVSAAKSCQERTEQMLEQCSSIDFLKLANGNNGAVSKKHKRSESTEDAPKSKRAKRAAEGEDRPPTERPTASNGQRIPVTKDPSGLFLIDSNPDDVDVLMKLSKDRQKNQKKQKRGHEPDADDDYIDVPLEVEESDLEQSTPKRKKAKHRDAAEEPVDDDNDYTKHLEQKVALRLKEKELVRKQNANKKRKRESDVSIEETPDDDEKATKQPPPKKLKEKAAAGTQPDPPKVEKGIKRKKKEKPGTGQKNDTSQPKSKKKKGKNSG